LNASPGTAGRELLDANTRALLGPAPPGRDIRIMVTMPGEAADDGSLVRDLLTSGMDCMRINTAHDDASAWDRMLRHLEEARSAVGRPCRVAIDLAGPKLRTGPIQPASPVIRWRPTRDIYGRVLHPARVWLTGRSEVIPTGPVVNFSVSLSRDGKRMAYRSVGARNMGDVYVMDLAGGRATRLTEVNPELKGLDLGELKPIRWKSFDGMEIWGLLLTPPGYAPGKRVPLVVYAHGGPIGGFTYGIFPQFMHIVGQVDPYPVEAMASADMAVFFPMPRGGSGYGVEGFRMILRSWGEGDYRDIMAGVDYLIAQGIADPERLGVMGGSYGGFMTNWIVTQTGRFIAASTMCSVSDLADLYFLSDAGDFMVEYFGLPWQAAESYVAHSPVTHAAKVTTPLLIQHGENDQRVPIMQAKKFYKALKELKKTVEMEIYPRGGHVIFEPDLQREMMRRNLEWFMRWLKPGSAH